MRELPAGASKVPVAPPEWAPQARDSRVATAAGAASKPDGGTSFRSDGPIRFQDVTQQTGVDFLHVDGSSGRHYIVESVASGMATFDYDNDGWADVYFINGTALPGCQYANVPRNRLFRNRGDWRFDDVTDAAGVGDLKFGLGVTVGDHDQDGFADVYISNLGANVLYRNNGDGSFSDVTDTSGVAAEDSERVGAGAAFLDADVDGDLDILAANYLRFSPEMKVVNYWRGVPIYPGPERFPPVAACLFLNNGDGTFTNASESSGIGRHPGYGMGIVCTDVDGDGDTDVFVGNDGGPGNFLFINDGRGRFEQTAIESGVAYTAGGLVNGNMGVDSGDYDNDGRPDFFVTSYQHQLAILYRNLGDGRFEDVTQRTGAGIGSFGQVTWGCGLVDLDCDGHRDIFYVCGHLIDNIDSIDDSASYLARPVVLRNTREGRFVDVSPQSGEGLQKKSVGRGAAFEDLDHDGDLDVVILNSRREPTFLRNDSPLGQWIQLELHGTTTCRDAVGARVTVTTGKQVQTAEVHSGRAYQSHFGTRLHFGLGSHSRIDRVEVHWEGGETSRWEDLEANAFVALVQESARAFVLPLANE